jgi:hypothetical protein
MIREGISYDSESEKFRFNWNTDDPQDIIRLVSIRRKISTKIGVQYYAPYVALPRNGEYTPEYKSSMKLFREKLKKVELDRGDINKMIDVAIDGLLHAYGDEINNVGMIVTPRSSSTLNKIMSERLHKIIPNARLVNDLFIKNSVEKISINTDKIKGSREQQISTENLMLKILEKFKSTNTPFNFTKIHPKYRNLFFNFMKLSDEIGFDVLQDIKNKDILVVDDYLTKGTTMQELSRILKENKNSGNIINFVLVIQG